MTKREYEAVKLDFWIDPQARREQVCKLKKSFRSKAKATRFIQGWKGGKDGHARWPYQCKICGEWHISSSVPGSR